MRAGNLNQQIELQSKVVSENSFGEMETAKHRTFAQIWADVRYLSARELFYASQIKQQASVEISIRFKDGIDSGQRVLLSNGKALEIESVLPDDKGRWLKLLCKEES